MSPSCTARDPGSSVAIGCGSLCMQRRMGSSAGYRPPRKVAPYNLAALEYRLGQPQAKAVAGPITVLDRQGGDQAGPVQVVGTLHLADREHWVPVQDRDHFTYHRNLLSIRLCGTGNSGFRWTSYLGQGATRQRGQ
jgi:hypothetical protein